MEKKTIEVKVLSRILVSRTDRIGDLVLTLPVFETLKAAFPQARVTALVSEYAADVVRGHPAVDEIWAVRGTESFSTFYRGFKDREIEAALFVYPRPKPALAAWAARVPVRVGTAYRWYSFSFNRKIAVHRSHCDRHELEYNLDLLDPLGVRKKIKKLRLFLPPEAKRRARRLLKAFQRKKIVAVHPGSGGSNWNWPLERYAGLMEKLLEHKRIAVVLTAGEKEAALVQPLLNRWTNLRKRLLVLCGVLSIKELAAVYQQVQVLVCSSTGPMHLAAAVGCPTVALFGLRRATSPVRWGPFGNQAIVHQPEPRAGEETDGRWAQDAASMERITVEAVYRSVRKLARF